MGRREKLLLKILGGASDANIKFEDICNLLMDLGFVERTRGSHHIFRKESVAEKVNLQRDGSNAKPY
jgi:hypothetical protein